MLHSHLTLIASNYALFFPFTFLASTKKAHQQMTTHWMTVLLLKMLKWRLKSLQALDEWWIIPSNTGTSTVGLTRHAYGLLCKYFSPHCLPCVTHHSPPSFHSILGPSQAPCQLPLSSYSLSPPISESKPSYPSPTYPHSHLNISLHIHVHSFF